MESAAIRQPGAPVSDEASSGGITRAGGWAPADPAPLGLAGFRPDDVRAEHVQRGPRELRRRAGCVWGSRSPTAALAQLLAGMWEFRTGNTFGATAFTSYGAFWISFWALVTFFAGKIPAADPASGRPLPHRLGHLHLLHVRRLAAHHGGGGGGVRPAGDHVHPARDRQLRAATRTSSTRRLYRPRHGLGGLVRVVRRGAQLHVQANDLTGRDRWPSVMPRGASRSSEARAPVLPPPARKDGE